MSNEQIVKYLEKQDKEAKKKTYKMYAYCLRYLDEIEGEIMKNYLLDNISIRRKISSIYEHIKELESFINAVMK